MGKAQLQKRLENLNNYFVNGSQKNYPRPQLFKQRISRSPADKMYSLEYILFALTAIHPLDRVIHSFGTTGARALRPLTSVTGQTSCTKGFSPT